MAAGPSQCASRRYWTRRRNISFGLFRTLPLTLRSWTFASGVKGGISKTTRRNLRRCLPSQRPRCRRTKFYPKIRSLISTSRRKRSLTLFVRPIFERALKACRFARVVPCEATLTGFETDFQISRRCAFLAQTCGNQRDNSRRRN